MPLPSNSGIADASGAVDFFNRSVKLCRILHQTIYSLCSPEVAPVQSLDELYDHYFCYNPGDPSKPSVLDIERSLSRWHEDIEDHLKYSSPKLTPVNGHRDDTHTHILRLGVILQQKYKHLHLIVALSTDLTSSYLHVRLLLLRPFLSAVITFEPDTNSYRSASSYNSLAWSMSLQCAKTCVRLAQETIMLIHEQQASKLGDVGTLSAWYVALQYKLSTRHPPVLLNAARRLIFIVAGGSTSFFCTPQLQYS